MAESRARVLEYVLTLEEGPFATTSEVGRPRSVLLRRDADDLPSALAEVVRSMAPGDTVHIVRPPRAPRRTADSKTSRELSVEVVPHRGPRAAGVLVKLDAEGKKRIIEIDRIRDWTELAGLDSARSEARVRFELRVLWVN